MLASSPRFAGAFGCVWGCCISVVCRKRRGGKICECQRRFGVLGARPSPKRLPQAAGRVEIMAAERGGFRGCS
eukprot:1426032-Prymnesium_polylepis.1